LGNRVSCNTNRDYCDSKRERREKIEYQGRSEMGSEVEENQGRALEDGGVVSVDLNEFNQDLNGAAGLKHLGETEFWRGPL